MTTTTAGQGRWTKRLIGGLGALALVAMAVTLATMGMHNTGIMPLWDGHIWGWGMGSGLGWGLMWIIGLLWMVVLVAIPVALIYWLVGGRTDEEAGDSALTVLRERYARGEIDDEEYQTRRATLETR